MANDIEVIFDDGRVSEGIGKTKYEWNPAKFLWIKTSDYPQNFLPAESIAIDQTSEGVVMLNKYEDPTQRIHSKVPTDTYKENYDGIFGKKETWLERREREKKEKEEDDYRPCGC